MTALAMSSALFGLALGIRLKFFSLLPILTMGALLATVLSVTQDLPLAQGLSTIVVFAGFLQSGYLVSAVLRHAFGTTIVIGDKARLVESEATPRP